MTENTRKGRPFSMLDNSAADMAALRERLTKALLAGDAQAAAELNRLCPAGGAAGWKNEALDALTDRYLAGETPFCQLAAAAQAARALYDPKLKPIACCGAVKGNPSKAGRDYMMMLLTAWGVPALDLGTDVDAETFLDAIEAYEMKAAVLALFSDRDAECVLRLDALAKERDLRDRFSLLICGAGMEVERLNSLPIDFKDFRGPAVARWMVMNAWKS